jgi:PST family polysaccharide transporter
MAPLHLFAVNLNSVLFPSLSLLEDDPQRQATICRRVSSMLALVVTPLSLVQAVIAGPAIRLIFEPAWHAMIPLVQVLSLGMALRCIGWPSASLLQAQGRFSARLALAAAWAILLLAAVGCGAWLEGVLGGALAVSLIYTIVGPVTLFVALKPHQVRLQQLLVLCGRPLLAGLAVAGPAWGAGHLIGSDRPGLQLPVTLLTAMLLYVPAIRFADLSAATELSKRLIPRFAVRFFPSSS